MVPEDSDIFEAVIRKLDKLTKLDELDIQALKALPYMVVSAEAGKYLVREHQSETSCCILLSGYACRHKTTFDGRRQIVSFHIPGDILDVQQILFSIADHNIQTITKTDYIVVPCADLKRVVDARPHVAEALWRDTLIDASVFREWVLNVGRRNAKERVAHMLCEFACRIEHAKLGSAHRFELPMTQEDIADATGLTPVHVNRTLAVLSSEGVIERDKREIRIADWQRMRKVAGFDPAYLHEAA
jgi:CRP-like cAMP-binding protein